MHTLTTFVPDASLLRFGAWSVLLHVGAISILGVLHSARPIDHPKPLVTVTLMESPTPASKDAPPMLHTEQPVAPHPSRPSPDQRHLPPQRTTHATDVPPARHADPPVTREILLARRASDTAKMKQFMKAPARRTTPATSPAAVPHDAQPIVTATPNATKVWAFHETRTPALATHANARDTPKVLRDSTADRKSLRTPARPVNNDHPPYPYTARERGWEGTVVLRLTVTREGTVEQAAVRTSSGFPVLDESALETVQAWRFEPARDGEFAIPTTVELPIRFALDDP